MNRNLLVIGVGRALQILVALVSMRLMTHLLSGAEVGNVYLILSLTSYFSLVFLSPVGQYMTRRLHAWHLEGNLLNYFTCYNVYVVLVSLSAFPFLFAAKYFFGVGAGIATGSLCLLAFSYIYCGTWNSTVIPALNMLHHRLSFVVFTTGTLLLGLIFSAALVKFHEASAVMWIAGQILGFLLLAMLSLWYFAGRLKYGVNGGFVLSCLKAPQLGGVAKFGLPLLVTTFFMWMQNQSYRLIVEKYLGLEFLGMIAVGLGIAAAIASAAESLAQQIYYPLFYSEITTADGAKRRDAWNKMAGLILPFYLLITLFVSFLAWHLVNILVDVKFRAAWIFTIFGAWVELFRITTNILSAIAHSEMRTEALAKPYIYGGVVTAAGVFLAAKSGAGHNSVPVALVLGGFATFLGMYISMKAVMPFSMDKGDLKKTLLFSLPFPAALLVKQGSVPASILVLALFGGYMVAAQYLLYRKKTAGEKK